VTRATGPAKQKIIAAIPCFNEEQFINDVAARTKRYANKVIVIDDGSTDNTSEAAKAAGAEVIRHERRQGVGAATRAAFEAAKANNADVLITLDGDGQHNPDEIPQVLAPILHNEADMVIGSRFLRPNHQHIPKYRKFGINVITWLYNLGAKTKVSDSQSCFRAYGRKLLEAVDITENGFSFSVQVLIQARKKRLTIAEVPISCVYHAQGSTINPLAHGLGVAWKVVKLRLRNLLWM